MDARLNCAHKIHNNFENESESESKEKPKRTDKVWELEIKMN